MFKKQTNCNKVCKLTLLSVLFLFFSIIAKTQNVMKVRPFGNGIINIVDVDSTSWSMKMGARFQFLSSGIYDDASNNLKTNFLIRRARLKFDGFAFSPKLFYKIELGLSNRDITNGSIYSSSSPGVILDAVLRWNFYKNLTLVAGQTKLPGNIERIISSANLQTVDRSLLNSQFQLDRDLGFQLKHSFKLGNNFFIRETLAFTQGEGKNVTKGNEGGYLYTGRIEFLPFGKFAKNNEFVGSALEREASAKLMFATTYAYNNDAVKTRGVMGDYMEVNGILFTTDISTLFVDAVFKQGGFSFMGEFAQRFSDNSIFYNILADGSKEVAYRVNVGKGFNLQSGYLFKNNWEIVGRYSQVNIEDPSNFIDEIQNQYTVGFSKYLSGHKLKVQTDFSYLDVFSGSNEFTARLQFDIHF